MDFLNKSLAQLKDLFQSMTPQARVTTGLLLVVVVVSLGYLFLHRTANSDADLFGGASFNSGELRDMEAAFGAAGLNDYRFDGSKIRVPRGKRHAYLGALADGNALPYLFGEYLEKALDTGPFGRSSEERREALKLAKQQELTSIIRAMQGVEDAAVLYDEEEKGTLKREKVGRASVVVWPVGAADLDASLASAVRDLVVWSFAGLKPENVAVTDGRSGHRPVGGPDGPAAAGDRYIARKRAFEQAFEEKVRALFAHIAGLQVKASVELDRELLHREEAIEHNPKPVAIQTSDTERTRTVESSNSGGRPGAVAQSNSAQSLKPTQSSGANEEERETETQTVNAISSTRTNKETLGLMPKRVTVALQVPSSYFERIWHTQNPTDPNAATDAAPEKPSKEDLERIRNDEISNIQQHVVNLLPETDGVKDKTELVTVTVYQDIKPEEPPGPGLVTQVVHWLSRYWTTIGMIGLVALSLLVVRSMVRPAPSSEPAARVSPLPDSQPLGEEAAVDEATAPKRLGRFETGGASLRDELSELVNEDPDAAANILSTWIGNTT
jgi:flagellar M-ring protein FliF